MYGGQTIDVGSLTFSNDDEFLYVTYSTEGGWYLKETHLYVGCPEPNEINNGIPSNNAGNPVIGHFPFTMEHSPMVTSYTYQIALSNFDDCLMGDEPECLIMATHASVALLNSNNEEIQSETAFQECDENTTPFEGNRWGCYSSFCPGECEEEEDPDLAWLYKDTFPHRVTCFTADYEEETYSGFSNRYNYTDWGYVDGVSYPVFMNLNNDCDNTDEELVGYVTIYLLDYEDVNNARVKLVFKAEGNYAEKVESWYGWVGWPDPVVNGEIGSGLSGGEFTVPVVNGEAEYVKYVKDWVGSAGDGGLDGDGTYYQYYFISAFTVSQ